MNLLIAVTTFVAGMVVGALLRRRPAPRPAPAAPPPSSQSVVAPQAEAPGSGNVAVARAVISVAQRVASPELARRLGNALNGLDGVAVISPREGSMFDASQHVWEDTVPGGEPGTVAAVVVPGIANLDGTVLVKARVNVHE